jgi:hypothetical protein
MRLDLAVRGPAARFCSEYESGEDHQSFPSEVCVRSGFVRPIFVRATLLVRTIALCSHLHERASVPGAIHAHVDSAVVCGRFQSITARPPSRVSSQRLVDFGCNNVRDCILPLGPTAGVGSA